MQTFARLLLLAISAPLLAQSAPHTSPSPVATLLGDWSGSATVRGQQVPVLLRLSGSPAHLRAALLNGPESAPASSVTFGSGHLLATFNYFARTLDASLSPEGVLTGTFGTTATRYPVELTRSTAKPAAKPASTPAALPSIAGDWEIAVHSAKGESAWQLHVDQPSRKPASAPGLRAVIQRIDGDTGSLYGAPAATPSGPAYLVSHLTAAGPALYSLTPRPDGTLIVSNLLAPEAQRAQQQNLVARRPAQARQQNLAPPTASTQQTSLKDPSTPLHFSGTDLSGHTVTQSDPRFRGKVVIVAIGGSWCPNCHDEAPLLESLYKQFHPQGLEVVDLSFEEADQLKDPSRLRAFIARYNITYPVLLAGDPDQLTQKITGVNNLNAWPTSFFIGRNGLVREIHAGFAGPANRQAHDELIHETTALVQKLLAEPTPTQTAHR